MAWTPAARARGEPPSVTAAASTPGMSIVAVALGGTVTSRVNGPPAVAGRRQSTRTGPRVVGTRPDAHISPDRGGETSNDEPPGPVTSTPRSSRWISRGTLEPHPCDMLSPLLSWGFQTSQVNVAPRASMCAQPSMAGSVTRWRKAASSPLSRSDSSSSPAVLGCEDICPAATNCATAGRLARRHHAVHDGGCVGRLRRRRHLTPVGREPVGVDPVRPRQPGIDRRGERVACCPQRAASPDRPSTAATSAVRRNTSTANTLRRVATG